ncbi:PREDICTED: uncharacterized protein LOC108782311 [Cyphomyrmex costatus]|uniref:uncharacterized protein LOC108782311 n=1 Tax=Cyphomyrmex costatus TaxID=456900 RepID=UPI00085235BB|nr:PREDICTED: uncharacterized protein LOC108782311 [Cyphomyrmex costatus]
MPFASFSPRSTEINSDVQQFLLPKLRCFLLNSSRVSNARVPAGDNFFFFFPTTLCTSPKLGTDQLLQLEYTRQRSALRSDYSSRASFACEWQARVATLWSDISGPSPIRYPSPSDRRVRDSDSRSPRGWRNGGDGARTSRAGLAQGHALPSHGREFCALAERFSV